MDLIAQAVGAVAAVLGISAWQLRRDPHLITALAATAGLWCIHFLLLGAVTAAVMHAMTVVRNVLALLWPSAALGFLFVAAYAMAGAATWQSWWDVLPTLAVCLGAGALFLATGLLRRGGLLLGSLLWLIFSIHVGSIGGIVIMAAQALSNGLFIGRTLWQRRNMAGS